VKWSVGLCNGMTDVGCIIHFKGGGGKRGDETSGERVPPAQKGKKNFDWDDNLVQEDHIKIGPGEKETMKSAINGGRIREMKKEFTECRGTRSGFLC